MIDPKEKGSAPTEPEKPAHESSLIAKYTRTPKKIHRIMSAFARGETLNFIEAQRLYHDRSLHSTVSEIQRDYGISIAREWETIPGFMGIPTRCRRYWMAPAQREMVREILGGCR